MARIVLRHDAQSRRPCEREAADVGRILEKGAVRGVQQQKPARRERVQKHPSAPREREGESGSESGGGEPEPTDGPIPDSAIERARPIAFCAARTSVCPA